MATLAEIRGQYPQYSDMTDTQLADAFHSKFYADIPKDTFYARLGVPVASEASAETARLATRFPAPAPQPAPAPEQPSTMQRMFGLGSPIARTIKGAVVDPALAVNQLLANTGLFGQDIRAGANQLVRDVEGATTEARARVGSEGFDPYQLLGGVISPVNKLVGLTQAPAAIATSLSARAGQAAGTGAALAALQPVNAPSDQFAEKKLEQMATGAVLGPILEGGVKAIGAIANSLKGLTPSGRTEFMRNQLNELAGEDKTKVIEALRDAKELVSGSRPTAAQALSDVPSSVELVAAMRKLDTMPGLAGRAATRTAEQQAARVRAVQSISSTEADRVALKAQRGEVTGPMRETALEQADLAGPIFTRLEKEIAGKFNSVAAAEQTSGLIGSVVPTQQAVALAGKPGWLSAGDLAAEAAQRSTAYKGLAGGLRKEAQLKEFQLKSLEQNGFFPLRADDITSQMDAAIRGTTSDQSKAVLQAMRDKIAMKADENGMLNSRDLYENVRKTSNQEIAKLLGLGEQYASGGLPQQAAKALGNVKSFVDAALNKSSDGLWSKYLKSYADYSTKLDRMEVGDFLVKQLQTPLDKERAGVFAAAIENAASTIKKSTGIPRYDKLSDVLTPKEVGVVNSVVADLRRSAKATELAGKVTTPEIGVPSLTQDVPSLLSRTVTIGRAALEHIQKGNAAAFNREMARLNDDPAALATFMTSSVPKGKIADLTSSMMKLMDGPTRAAFTQSFLIPSAAREVGAAPQE
jgi:hypothetical protein